MEENVKPGAKRVEETNRLWWALLLLGLLCTLVAVDAAIQRDAAHKLAERLAQVESSVPEDSDRLQKLSSALDSISTMQQQLTRESAQLEQRIGLTETQLRNFSFFSGGVDIEGPKQARARFSWGASGIPYFSILDTDGNQRFAAAEVTTGTHRGEFCVFVFAKGASSTSRVFCENP